MGFIDSVKAKYTTIKAREAALEKQARERIPKEYHDFLLLLDQNQELTSKKIDNPEETIGPGVWSGDRGTYVPVRLPYLAVDGRVRMAIDEHTKAGKKLSIEFKTQWTLEAEALLAMDATAQGLVEALVGAIPKEFHTILTCIAESEIYGRFEGSAKIGWGGAAVDRTNPYENSQTSALGRALGNMGYGLLGTGIASYEEVKAAIAEQEAADRPPKPSGMPGPKATPPQAAVSPNGANPEPSGGTTTSEAAPPSSDDSDPALTQTEGPCADCGEEAMMDKVWSNFIKPARGRGERVRWSHAAVKTLGCEKAKKIAEGKKK